ncbi:MAG: ATP-binding cassette domain-containing protein [Lentisphaeria bacterium]|jgi:ABC-2 type transport system ATP-binding protein
MPLIQVDHLSKTYRTAIKAPGWRNTLRHFFRRTWRDVPAVRDVSFAIESGEIVGFLGPNGAGKTTTLKMLTGLLFPTAGTAQVAGFTPFRRQHGFLRRITLVMGQKQQLIWDLPTLDSLRINAAIYELAEPEAARRTAELAELLGLGDKLKVPVRKLSLGERMKAELLAALLHRPDILFLDEPTLGLDVNAQAAVRDFLRAYNRQYGATILLTSHYMADIQALCPRVLLIHEGALCYDGSLDGIRRRFAPWREVKLELEHEAVAAELRPYGELSRVEGRTAELIVRREALTETVTRLLEAFAIRDFTITDPALETILARIFADGSLNPPK